MQIKKGGSQVTDMEASDGEAWKQCEVLCRNGGLEPLSRESHGNELHYLAPDESSLIQAVAQLAADGYFLVTMVANDEKGLRESGRFCLYYIFSHPIADLFLWLSYILPADLQTYPSLRPHFASVESFEREIYDLFGIQPREQSLARGHGARLHEGCYPENFHPLLRDRSLAEIRQQVREHFLSNHTAGRSQRRTEEALHPGILPDGEMLIPVGPIHAGVIEPGHFLFHLEGEVVSQLDIRLGYKHRGIERLFQEYTIGDARSVQLAEFVCGDAAFAHSLAFCRAVEKLTNMPIPLPAKVIRSFLLELERMTNLIGDCAGLAHDVALDVISSDMAMLRQKLLDLSRDITGHGFLRGVNTPGGTILPGPLDPKRISTTVGTLTSEFARLSWTLGQKRLFRSRARHVGILKQDEAQRLGTTGIIARASGGQRDFRLNHPDPMGVCISPDLRKIIQHQARSSPSKRSPGTSLALEAKSPPLTDGSTSRGLRSYLTFLSSTRHFAKPRFRGHVGLDHLRDGSESGGDVYARFQERVRQVDYSAQLVAGLLGSWDPSWREEKYKTDLVFPDTLQRSMSLGYVEGWRGEVVYWLMVEPSGRIYRCKIRDASMLNWPALEEAVRGNYLSDFPLINKSFSLSYSANDL